MSDKKYSLQETQMVWAPKLGRLASSNKELAAVHANSRESAISKLQKFSPAKLDAKGYGKKNGITYIVGEYN